MLYKSTRGGESDLSFEQILFSSYACDGGLYVPQDDIPSISFEKMYQWRDCSFQEICAEVVCVCCVTVMMYPCFALIYQFIYLLFGLIQMHLYTDISLQALQEMTRQAFVEFPSEIPFPMTTIDNVILLDLSHGPTLAFKDVGQQMTAQLLNHYLMIKNKANSKVVKAKILVDTSGDTGPAAISAVTACPFVDLTVLYPYGRISAVQELQMITSQSPNVHVYRTEGNNDDQSSVLKELFLYADFVTENGVCSINSINWARVAAQSTYYV